MKTVALYISFICISILAMDCQQQDAQSLPPEKQQYYISNYSCNNRSELNHIKATLLTKDTLFFGNRIAEAIQQIDSSWIIGQGTGEIYYDTGKENLFPILEINTKHRWIRISNSSQFKIENALVFWKKRKLSLPILKNKGSWGYSKIIFDSLRQEYQTHFFECDTKRVQLYIGRSKNLINWKKDSLPILQPNNFKDCNWNLPFPNRNTAVTPLISDIVHHKGKYYCFAYGDDLENKTYISLLITDSLDGTYNIHPDPIVSPDYLSDIANHDVYMPRVVKIKNQWIMFYTAKNELNHESICRATSTDLFNWRTRDRVIISKNEGWNSNQKNQLVSNLQYRNDTLFMWCTGTKSTTGIRRKLNKGNVEDIAIGKFYSLDDGNIFTPCDGNPVFGGNPNNTLENDHVGAPIQIITKNDSTYTFYHAKGRKNKKYTVLLDVN